MGVCVCGGGGGGGGGQNAPPPPPPPQTAPLPLVGIGLNHFLGEIFRPLIKQYVFKIIVNDVNDVVDFVYLQLKIWICLFTKHVLF